MSGGNDLILTLVFLGLAVFVIVKLRAVLGQRTGFERPPEAIRREMEERQRGLQTPPGQSGVPTGAPMGGPSPDNVLSFPNGQRPPPLPQQPELTQAERWRGVAEPGTPLADGLDAIVAADPTFDPRDFVAGARQAYEMIVQAYAKGDRKTLKTFLAKEVYDGFATAIGEREGRGETAETTFVSIDKADLIAAEMRESFAHVTVSFGSKIITVVRGRDGAVVDGSAERIVDVNDIWTFARDATSRDPNWKLVATESNG